MMLFLRGEGTSMATYLFYPRRADDAALTFEARECANDADALAKAEAVLHEHTSAVFVGVWEGERMVGRVAVEAVHRATPTSGAALR
jgi:hypothetical protein